MKTLTLEMPDDLYERVARRATEAGTSLSKEVLQIVARSTTATDDQALSAERGIRQSTFRRGLGKIG